MQPDKVLHDTNNDFIFYPYPFEYTHKNVPLPAEGELKI